MGCRTCTTTFPQLLSPCVETVAMLGAIGIVMSASSPMIGMSKTSDNP